jgi:hypothetical protein
MSPDAPHRHDTGSLPKALKNRPYESLSAQVGITGNLARFASVNRPRNSTKKAFPHMQHGVLVQIFRALPLPLRTNA